MPHAYHQIAFTPAVQALQDEAGSRRSYARMNEDDRNGQLGANEAAFLQEAESLYLGSVSETGWPYIQHRGGPKGFVRVLGPDLIGWAEFGGNRQYVTTGNLAGDDRLSLFVMDYARKARLKLFGRGEVIGVDDERMQTLLPDTPVRARIERGLLIRVEGFDWNCPAHIPQMFTLDQVGETHQALLKRIAELEERLA